MDDLSHWDVAVEFSAIEAAALIRGADPSSPEFVTSHADPVFNLLRRCYEARRQWIQMDAEATRTLHSVKSDSAGTAGAHGSPESIDVAKHLGGLEIQSADQMLESIEMAQRDGLGTDEASQSNFIDWVKSDTGSNLGNQRFSRNELAKWLKATGLKSSYQFAAGHPIAIEAKAPHWPWGDHHTELLGHLEAAAMRFWVNHDPTDCGTASINEMVRDWLVQDRKISENMAKAIATILRHDGLRTGPR